MITNELHLSFLGCSQDAVEINFAALMTEQRDIPPEKLWGWIQTEKFSTTEMLAFLRNNGVNLSSTPLSSAQFIFFIRNLTFSQSSKLKLALGKHAVDLIERQVLQPTFKSAVATPPPAIQEKPEILARWFEIINDVAEFKRMCSSEEIPEEQCNLILPLGTSGDEMFSLNFRSIQLFLDEFLCDESDWELKLLANQLYQSMTEEFPSLSNRLGKCCEENRNLYCDKEIATYQRCSNRFFRPHKDDISRIWEGCMTEINPDLR